MAMCPAVLPLPIFPGAGKNKAEGVCNFLPVPLPLTGEESPSRHAPKITVQVKNSLCQGILQGICKSWSRENEKTNDYRNMLDSTLRPSGNFPGYFQKEAPRNERANDVRAWRNPNFGEQGIWRKFCAHERCCHVAIGKTCMYVLWTPVAGGGRHHVKRNGPLGCGGQGGIRTLETIRHRLHTFQACAFNRSATCPTVPAGAPAETTANIPVRPDAARRDACSMDSPDRTVPAARLHFHVFHRSGLHFMNVHDGVLPGIGRDPDAAAERVLKFEEQHERGHDDYHDGRGHQQVDAPVPQAEKPRETDDAGGAYQQNQPFEPRHAAMDDGDPLLPRVVHHAKFLKRRRLRIGPARGGATRGLYVSTSRARLGTLTIPRQRRLRGAADPNIACARAEPRWPRDPAQA